MTIPRRDFVVGAVSVAALCAVGGVAHALPAGTEPVRPVGGQDESAFLAACIRCDRCRSVCPTGCVDIARLEDGLIQMRTPKMNYHRGYCIFCDKCVKVCPTSALHSIDIKTEKLGVAVIMTDQCIAWRNPGSCSKCRDACIYGAVSIVNGLPVVSSEICNGCGRCVDACPALVYSSTQTTNVRGVEVLTVEDFDKRSQQ